MKKLLATLLFILMMVSIIFTLPVQRAQAYSGYDYASGALGDRLNTIINSGISGCVSPSIPAVGSSLNNSQWYTTSYANQSGTSKDKQCQAYARAAYSYMFGYNMGVEAYRREITSAKGKNSFDFSFFQQNGIRCGAYLRTTPSSAGKYNGNDGHSIIILSYNSSGVTTLEGNADGKGKISIIGYSWSSFNYSAFGRRGRYVCSLSQPTDAIYASITPDIPPSHDAHVKGEFQFYEALHPHYNYWRCSICGENFTDGSTAYVASCSQCNPGLSIVSQKDGLWDVVIPANYNLLLYDDPLATSNLTNKKPDSESYTLRVNKEAVLSDGTVRYGRMWDHKGTDMLLWFTATGSMTITDVSHTTHEKGEFRYTASEHPHYNYYACSVCGEVFTDGSTTVDYSCSQCHPEHTKGEFVYTMLNHPHERFFRCSVCGYHFTDGSREIKSSCSQCRAESATLQVVSLEKIDWTIIIPEYSSFDLFYDVSETLTGSTYEVGEGRALVDVTKKADMSDGSTRFSTGYADDGQWFTLSDDMIIDKHTTWDDGVITVEPTTNSTGKIVYTCMGGCGRTKIEVLPMLTITFDDVSSTAYYAKAVTWAVQKGITSGTGNNKFSPNQPCTRAQIATFIWNANGKPVASSAEFSDMPSNSVFCKAISWAVEKGLTSGTGNNRFSPNAKCTRVQAVTFLWIAAGKPEPAQMATFSDMTGNSTFDKAISWAVEKGITSGTGNNKFSPKAVCNRGQIATFLYKCKAAN